MANLTEDQKRAFGNRIAEILGQPDTAAALTAKDSGLDPSKRLTKLTAKAALATEAEGLQTQAQARATAATKASVAATSGYYGEASGAAESLISELGEDHEISKAIRKLRGGMVNEKARGPRAPKPAKPA